MKRFLLLLAVVMVLSVVFAAPAQAQGGGVNCEFCSASGHGGGNPCSVQGFSNSKGCFCGINPKTHVCQMSGCPCTCSDGLCSCGCSITSSAKVNASVAPIKNQMEGTPENIEREYTKWYEIFTKGGYEPGQDVIFHVNGPLCMKSGAAFLVGMMMAATTSHHHVIFLTPDDKETPEQFVAEGLTPEGKVP